LAKVLRASTDQVFQTAEDLGLKYRQNEWRLWEKRGYQTIIRRNWDLLNREQLLQLLDWSDDKLEFVLKPTELRGRRLRSPRLAPRSAFRAASYPFPRPGL